MTGSRPSAFQSAKQLWAYVGIIAAGFIGVLTAIIALSILLR